MVDFVLTAAYIFWDMFTAFFFIKIDGITILGYLIIGYLIGITIQFLYGKSRQAIENNHPAYNYNRKGGK